MNKTITTIVVAVLLAVTMIGIRHIDKLNDGIELKQIQLQDNSAKLKILDQKYKDLNTELDKTGSDKAKVEQQLQDLQKERDSLQQQLQAKLDAKSHSIASRASNAVLGTAYAASGDSDKMFIYNHESGNRPGAVNSIGACGLGQALPCSKLPCSLTDYACQDNWFTNSYMIPRYGSWSNAKAFWMSHGYACNNDVGWCGWW
jgi:hypothetical protein